MPRSAEAIRVQSPDDKLVKARRRQIFLAACRVLARKSFHEASVKELALEAGFPVVSDKPATATFWPRFASSYLEKTMRNSKN